MIRTLRPTVFLLLSAVLMAVSFAVYAPALNGEFVSDDHRFIALNGANFEHYTEPWVYFIDAETNATPPDPDIYRPVRTWSFAIDHHSFGNAPLGYHVHNVLLHGLVASLVFLLLVPTFASFSRPVHGAFLAALLFDIHPLATEAVAWLSSRADLQVAVAMLLALLVARRAEAPQHARFPAKVPTLLGAALLAVLCGFCKESGVMVGALYLLEHRARTGRWIRGAFPSLVALSIGTLIYFGVYVGVRADLLGGQVDYYEGSFWSHLPYGLVGVARLVRLTLFPTDHHFLYEPLLFHPLASSTAVLAVLGLVVFVCLALFSLRKLPAVGCGLLWFLCALLPASNLVLPMRTVLAERFAYVPLIGVTMAVAAAASAWLSTGRAVRWKLAAIAAIVIALALATARRAQEWSTREALYAATLSSYPRSTSAAMGLASVAEERGDHARAAELYRQAADDTRGDDQLELLCRFAEARNLLGQQRHAEAAAMFTAIDRRLADDPALRQQQTLFARDNLHHLAVALFRQPSLDEAEAVVRRLDAEFGANAPTLILEGRILELRGELIQALELYRQAIVTEPSSTEARLRRVAILSKSPSLASEAIRELRELIARNPDDPRVGSWQRLLEEQQLR